MREKHLKRWAFSKWEQLCVSVSASRLCCCLVANSKGRESVKPAACEKGIDSGVPPILCMHHINVLEAVEVKWLFWKPTDEPGLEERRPHVLEESFWSAFIYLQNDTNKLQRDALSNSSEVTAGFVHMSDHRNIMSSVSKQEHLIEGKEAKIFGKRFKIGPPFIRWSHFHNNIWIMILLKLGFLFWNGKIAIIMTWHFVHC